MAYPHSLAILAVVVLAGCSMHPDTEDLSRDMIPVIVKKVRCEARDAVLATVADQSGYLMGTAVAFEFEFDLTVSAQLGTVGNITIPIHNGTFGFGFSSSLDKTRNSVQRTKFADTFQELAKLDDAECQAIARGPNKLYPITGEIGLASPFRSFNSLVVDQPGEELQTFFDQITFNTVVGGAILPRIDLVPGTGRKIGVGVAAGASRIDKHRVTLTFTAPKTPAQKLAVLEARKRELAKIREERRIPLSVRVLEKVDGPPAKDLKSGDRKPAGAPTSRGVGQPAARTYGAPVGDDTKARALRQLEDEQQRLLLRRLDDAVR